MLEDRTTPTPVISIVKGSDAYEGRTNGNFILSRTGDPSQSLYVSINVSGAGTATPGQDFAYITSYAEFAPGSSIATVTVNVIGSPYDDGIVDPDESVILSIAGPGQYYTVGLPSSATVTIHEPPAVSVVASNDSAEGGTDGTFIISRTGDTSQALTVGYSVGGTTTNGVDYPSLSGSVTIPANATAVNVSIDGYHDGLEEDDETVTLSVSGGGNYTVDEQNNSASLTLIDTDLPPQTTDYWAWASIGSPIAVSTLDLTFDGNDDSLTLTTVTQGENGSVTIGSGGEVTYTPDTGFTGDDSFTYTVEDQFGNDATGTISVTIFDLQAPPTSVWTAQNTAITVNVPDLAFDPDGQTLSTSAVTQGAHGSVVINGDGTVTYTPNASFSGDDYFNYTVEDPDGHTATQTITVTVGVAGPVALDNDATTDENTAVTVTVADNAFDPAGGSVTVTAVTQGAHGSIVLNQDGTVTYTPASGYEGSDSFTYTVTDSGSNTATGTISVAVGTATISEGDEVLNDLSDLSDQFDNYNSESLEAITGATSVVSDEVAAYNGDITNFVDANDFLQQGANKNLQQFAEQVFSQYMTLYSDYETLKFIEDKLYYVLTKNADLIFLLGQQLKTAINTPGTSRLVIGALKVQIESLILAQKALTVTWDDVWARSVKPYQELKAMYQSLQVAGALVPQLAGLVSTLPAPTLFPRVTALQTLDFQAFSRLQALFFGAKKQPIP